MERDDLESRANLHWTALMASVIGQGIATLTGTPLPSFSLPELFEQYEIVCETLFVTGLSSFLLGRMTLNETRLDTTGVYGATRNPIYGGFRLCTLAMTASGPSIASIIATGAVFITSELTVRAEERCLAREYGAAYDAYCSSVSRWIPYGTQCRKGIAGVLNALGGTKSPS